MCCNQEIFQQQEYRLRTELYAKDILDNKFKNVDYWTYTASTDGKYHVNKKLHKIEVPADDSLNGTYEKTYKTFKLLDQLNIDYDYILRTNCSTYINVNLLKSFVNRLTDELIIYSNNVYCTKDGTGPYEWSLYGVGNSLLLSKFWINIILNNHISKIKDINENKASKSAIFKIDDNAIGFTVNCYCLQKHYDTCLIWQSWKSPLPNVDINNASDYIAIPFREYNKKQTRDNEYDKSLYIHKQITENNGIYDDDYIKSLTENQYMHILDFDQNMHSIVTKDFCKRFMDVVYYPYYLKNVESQIKKK